MPLFSPYKTAHPGYLASRVYTTFSGSPITSAAISAVDIIYMYPFILPRPITFTKGIMRVQTAGAGSSVKAGIYASSPVSVYPLGAPLYKDDTGVATTASTSDVDIALGAGTLRADTLYWAGAKFTGTLPILWTAYLASKMMELCGALTTTPVGVLGYASAYASAMPTISEGASFTLPNAAAPILFLAT